MTHRALVFAALLFASTVAIGQTYEGSAGPGWVATYQINVWRDYGAKDAAGNYPYQPRYRTPATYVRSPDFRAARLIKVDPDLYAQYGDGTCAQFDAVGVLNPAACPTAAPAVVPPPAPPPVQPPPPVVLPSPVVPRPPGVLPPPASGAKVTTILVLPLRYQSPPSNDPQEVAAYSASLPKITQANLQQAYAAIPGWWATESYGTASAVVTVLPEVDIPGKRPCDWGGIVTDASLRIPVSTPRTVTVIVTPYQCWKSNGVGGGGNVVLWGTAPEGVAMVVHETGHALGLLHNASVINGAYNEYGSYLDQMGAGGNHFLLWHLTSDHKSKLGWMTPGSCKSATLRSFYQYPDAIQCGSAFLEYWPDWGFVALHKREFHVGAGGGSDSTDYALLRAGQSYTLDGRTYTHKGAGHVEVKP